MKACFAAFGLVGLFAIFAISNAAIKRPSAESIAKKISLCPPIQSLKGNCTFDEKVNCLTDASCDEGEKCCREGCNKICKPIQALPKDFPFPDFGVFNKWKAEKAKAWNSWADETRKMMMDRLAGLWEIATPENEK